MNLNETVKDLEKIIYSQYQNVVAAEITTDGSAILYLREGEDVTKKSIPFSHFILLESSTLLNSSDIKYELVELSGNARFATLAKFANSDDYKKALLFLKLSTTYPPSSLAAPYKVISDLQQQLFIDANFRLFRGMTFCDIRRMQFDIETLTTDGYEFPNAKRVGDSIAMISISDNSGWEECLVLNDPYSEKELLEKFVEIIEERNPDVLEGHNIFKFDLPFIEERAKRHKVKLLTGRDGSLIKKRNSRFNVAERTLNYPKYETFGRHFIDTFHLVQHYDVIHRELESYGLKAVAKHFGVASENRTYVDGGNITELFQKDPQTLRDYALDDVRETREISNILSPSYFYQTQLIPISYQNCIVRGNASRIESMLISAYIDAKASIPTPEQSTPFSGALTGAPEKGIFNNIWHCDVRSLYPSIILADKLIPSRDHLKIFPNYLEQLRSFRLKAKDGEKNATSKSEKDELNALQSTFKILINSFYGYLAFSMGTFNDYAMANKVTTKGREILTLMLDFLESEGAKIIEMDTDGVYFQPSSNDSATALDMENKIQAILPEGIEVEVDAIHPAMFCYKSKNYALLHDNGEISISGAALKSRGLEPFQRDFLKKLMHYLLNKDFESIDAMRDEYKNAIIDKSWDLAKFAKTETLKEAPEKYKKKLDSGKGRRSAAYELALKSDQKYGQGDQILYYVIGTKKKVSVVENSILLRDAPTVRNENTTYYLGKLDDLIAKFAEFIPNTEFDDNPLGLEF